MFSGIIEEIATVNAVSQDKIGISADKVMAGIAVGDSISVNGACLTLISRNAVSFFVNVVPETFRKTNLGFLAVGDPVNLERPVIVGGRLDGHVVQGHVDGIGTIESISCDGDALMVRIKTSSSVMRYVVEKGFIAVDGTSVTIVNCDSNVFEITVIPYTRENTLFQSRNEGDKVNLEVDVMAKYVERFSAK